MKSQMIARRWISAAAALVALGVAGPMTPGKSSAEDKYPVRRANQEAVSGQGATFTVKPGQSIQAVVDRCRPGDRIEVLPGVYREEVVIDLDNIQFIGLVQNGERPVLEGDGKLNDGVLVSGHNFVISGFEIRNYQGNGVVVNQAKNATFRDLVASNTGKYAVYPLQCEGVLVENCVASGVWDAAIYAGQCKDVVIQNCEAYHSTIGIETENTINALVANNTVHDNAMGILVVCLPNLPAKEMKKARVIGNRVINNNHPNTSPPGHIVNMVEPGVGIAINAADFTEVTGNTIQNNGAFGVSLYSLTDIIPADKLDVEPHSDNTMVYGNRYIDNGNDPSKLGKKMQAFGITEGGDLFWNGKGNNNLWDEATTRSFPKDLPRPASSRGTGGN